MKQQSVHTFSLSNNDKYTTHSCHIYTEWKEGEREQDTGETERECVCERGREVAKRGGIGPKNDHWRDRPFGIKIEGLF